MNKFAINTSLSLLLLSTFLVTSYSTATANASTAVEVQKVEQLKQQKAVQKIDDYLKKKQFNGSVLIAKDGKILLTKGYGLANFAAKTLIDKDTIFRIASVTKTFTATAIMQLAEQGKLKLEDPIHKYIPDFPSGDKITIHHLLSHTSGIPEFMNEDVFNDPVKRTKYVSQEELVDMVKGLKHVSEPGSKFLYSNSNYALLGYMIERVSHTTWDNYVNEYFFKPLNMYRSGVDINNPIVPNHAVGSGMYVEKNHDMSYSIAAGALYSTVGDLYKFDQALLSGKLISQQSLIKMLTPVLDAYGYGMMNGKNLDVSPDWNYHDGHIPGFISYNAINQKDNMEVILLTNKGPNNPQEFANLQTLKKELTDLATQLTK